MINGVSEGAGHCPSKWCVQLDYDQMEDREGETEVRRRREGYLELTLREQGGWFPFHAPHSSPDPELDAQNILASHTAPVR